MGKLFIVGTSIGNLEDLTIRSLKTLFSVPYILAEDTRTFIKLKTLIKERHPDLSSVLNLKDTNQKIISYREQNHEKALPQIVSLLQSDNDIALVSDAGMPGISDPGFKLIRDLITLHIEIDVIPGPTAADTALLLSGLPTDRFTFLGFLPRKDGKAVKLIKTYLNDDNTIIIYESPFRVIQTIELIQKNFGEISIAAATELTKLHQAVFRGTTSAVIAELKATTIRGEWVIVLRNLSPLQ